MDIILLAYLLLIVIAIRPNFLKDNNSFLSKDNTDALRGIMSIGIILHHISEHVESGSLFSFMQHMGYLLVAEFLLLSGFGLMIQYKNFGKKYLSSFWKKRILFFVIVFLLDTAIYSLFILADNGSFDYDYYLRLFIRGHMIAGSSWYLVAQIGFYFFFWISFRACSDNKKALVLLTILTLAYSVMFVLVKFPDYWYLSNLAFIGGVIFAEYKDRLLSVLNSRYWIGLFAALSLFAFFSAIPIFVPSLYVMCRVISSFFFAITIPLLLAKIRLTGSFWKKVNTISLELFLLHALVINFFRGNMIYIENDFLFTLSVIAASVLISVPAHFLNRSIKRCLSK